MSLRGKAITAALAAALAVGTMFTPIANSDLQSDDGYITLGEAVNAAAGIESRKEQMQFLATVFDLPEDETVLDEPAIVGAAGAVLCKAFDIELLAGDDGLPSAAATLAFAGCNVRSDEQLMTKAEFYGALQSFVTAKG